MPHNTGGRGREPGILLSLLCTTADRSVSGRNHLGLLPTPSQQRRDKHTFTVLLYTVVYHSERMYLQNTEKKYPDFFIVQLSYKLSSEVRLTKCRKEGSDSRQAQEEKMLALSPVLLDWVLGPSKVQSVWELLEHTPLWQQILPLKINSLPWVNSWHLVNSVYALLILSPL